MKVAKTLTSILLVGALSLAGVVCDYKANKRKSNVTTPKVLIFPEEKF